MNIMELTINEFPFVSEMPKREKSKVAKIWDQFQELSRLQKTHGILIPQAMAAKMLSVSPQRVWQFVEEGRLEFVEMNGIRFVTENSIVEFARVQRKEGRPPGRIVDAAEKGNVALLKESYRASRELLTEYREAASKSSKNNP